MSVIHGDVLFFASFIRNKRVLPNQNCYFFFRIDAFLTPFANTSIEERTGKSARFDHRRCPAGVTRHALGDSDSRPSGQSRRAENELAHGVLDISRLFC